MPRLRPWIPVVAAVLAIASVAWIAGAVEENDFYFENQTGATINELYVSPGYADDWGPDKLGRYALRHGQEFFVTFAKLHCRYDLKVVWEDGSDWVMNKKVDLCETNRIIMKCRRNGTCWAEFH